MRRRKRRKLFENVSSVFKRFIKRQQDAITVHPS